MTDDLQFLFSILHSPNDNVHRFQFCSQSKTERTSVGKQPIITRVFRVDGASKIGDFGSI